MVNSRAERLCLLDNERRRCRHANGREELHREALALAHLRAEHAAGERARAHEEQRVVMHAELDGDIRGAGEGEEEEEPDER